MLGGDEGFVRKLLHAHGVKTRLATGGVASTLRILIKMGVWNDNVLTFAKDGFWAKAGTHAMTDTFQLLSDMGVKVDH